MSALTARFIDLWQGMGCNHPDLAAAANALILRYEDPKRAYHNRTHLEDVLQKLDWAQTALHDSGELQDLDPAARKRMFQTIELALWYHDAIYDAKAKNNEAKSRDLMKRDAERYHLAPAFVSDAARLIELTAHHSRAERLYERIMVDCDLAILGADKQAFKKYGEGIRREYAHVPDALYRPGRAKVLQHFLDQKPIFKTRAFSDRYEQTARQNLAHALRPASPIARIKAVIFKK